MSTPTTNDGATNKAVSDANAGVRADTQTWSAPLRETYESVRASQTKKSS
jgi:hypothetical protein